MPEKTINTYNNKKSKQVSGINKKVKKTVIKIRYLERVSFLPLPWLTKRFAFLLVRKYDCNHIGG